MPQIGREKGRGFAQRLSDLMEEHAGGYDQSRYKHRCGTPGCVAGWAYFLARLEALKGAMVESLQNLHDMEIRVIAREALELEQGEDFAMFRGDPMGPYPATAQHAVAMLRRYAETGRIEWRRDDAPIKEEQHA